MTTTAEQTYRNAREAAREATRKFRLVQESYRARWIGDAEFLASRKAYNEASIAFDRASEARAAAGPEETS